MKYLVAVFIFLFGITPSFATTDNLNKFIDDDNSPNWCPNGQFPSLSKDYQLGQINRKARITNNDSNDDDDSESDDACPINIKKCQIKKIIKAKTPVIISKKFRDFYCIYNPRNSSSGWISEKDLTIVPAKETQISNWVGKWVDGRNFIEIKEKKRKERRTKCFWSSTLGGSKARGY